MSRVGRISGLALAAVLVLGGSACGASPGAAVTIDGQSLSQSLLTDQSAQLAGDKTDPDTLIAVHRAIINSRIQHQLIDRAAAAAGVQVTAEEVKEALSGVSPTDAAAQLQVPVDQVDSAVQDSLLLRKLVDKLPAAGVPVTDVTVKADVMVTGSRQEAIALRTKMQNAAKVEEAIAQAGAGKPTQQTFSLLGNASLAGSGLFAAQPGDVLIVSEQGQFVVVRVTSRTTADATLTPDKIGDEATALLILAPVAQSTAIEVNPRYGSFDPNSVQVIPGRSEL